MTARVRQEDIADEIACEKRSIASDRRQIDTTEFELHRMRAALARRIARLRRLERRARKGG